MRSFLTCLLALGIIAGLGGRVLAAVVESGHHCSASHEQCGTEHSRENSCGGHHHHHDEKGAPEHHHHCGGCLNQIPLGLDGDPFSRLPAVEIPQLSLRPESERVPDGPSPALDKPPLI